MLPGICVVTADDVARPFARSTFFAPGWRGGLYGANATVNRNRHTVIALTLPS
jgi:hypothetical protein